MCVLAYSGAQYLNVFSINRKREAVVMMVCTLKAPQSALKPLDTETYGNLHLSVNVDCQRKKTDLPCFLNNALLFV